MPPTIRDLGIPCFIAILLLTGSSAVAETDALSVQTDDPVYPRPAMQENREGWVLVDFDIDVDGRISNALVVDSIGGSEFELPAINAVNRWRYSPAERNGAPVFQGRNLEYVVFAINTRTRGSTKRFANRYNDVLDLIGKNELARAEAIATTVFDEWPMNLHELTKLWSLRAQLALLRDDPYMARHALLRATANSGEWLAKQTYQSLLLALVHIEIESGQFAAAIKTHAKLLALNPKRTDAVLQTGKLIRSLQEIIDNDQILATDGVLHKPVGCASCSHQWSFLPARGKFTINNVAGQLTAVDTVCDNARVTTAYLADIEWQIPTQFGNCRVDIHGNSETTFRIHQLPNSTD